MIAFLDANVLVYCIDITAPAKQARARALVARSTAAGEAVASTQVLIELFHTLTRKYQVPADAAQALTQGYCAWPVVGTDVSLVGAAIERTVQHRLSIWDAMIVEAALRSGAQTLYSEDLQHGQRIDGMTIVNPFQAELGAP